MKFKGYPKNATVSIRIEKATHPDDGGIEWVNVLRSSPIPSEIITWLEDSISGDYEIVNLPPIKSVELPSPKTRIAKSHVLFELQADAALFKLKWG